MSFPDACEDNAFDGLPRDHAAEQKVLSAMFFGGVASVEEASNLLSVDDFTHIRNQKIFAVLLDLSAKAAPIDRVTVADELSRRKELEQCGGPVYLLDLENGAFTAANLAYHANMVKSVALRRRLMEEGHRLYHAAKAGELDAAALVEETEKRIFALRPGDTGGENAKDLRQWIMLETNAIEEREHSAKNGGLPGTATGYVGLDYKLAGMKPGNLILLAARPSVGKSALATGIITNLVKAGGNVFFASLEMSGAEVTQRILSAEGKVDAHAVRTGEVDGQAWGDILAGARRLWDGSCIVDQTETVTPSSLKAAVRRASAKLDGLDLIVVDYIQLMSGGEAGQNRNASRNEEVSYISRSLKLLAKEFGVPVLALSQLSRDVEKRENKRPMLSDLRDSGSLEQDADVVIFLHRENYQSDTTSEAAMGAAPASPLSVEVAEVIIRKQRMGPTGTIKLGFIPAYARFENLSQWHSEP